MGGCNTKPRLKGEGRAKMVGVDEAGFDYSVGPDAPRNGPEGSHLADGSRQTRSSHVDMVSRETPGDSPHMWNHAHLNGVGDETNEVIEPSAFLSEKKVKSIVAWLEGVDDTTPLHDEDASL